MTGNLSLIRGGCYNLQQIGDNLEAIRVAELLLCFIVQDVVNQRETEAVTYHEHAGSDVAT